MTWLSKLTKQLLPVCGSVDQARQEVLWLACYVMDLDPALILFLKDLPPKKLMRLQALVKKRASGMPLGYVIGWVPFGPLEILVNKSVLVPRIETEEWCQDVLEHEFASHTSSTLSILDLCTGSGAIALFFAHERRFATVLGVDICSKALAVAAKNLSISGLRNVQFLKSDMYQKIPAEQTFDFIFSNPPYVTEKEFDELDPSVAKFEPKKALLGGLNFYPIIASGAQEHLKKSGTARVIVEIGQSQAKDVKAIFGKHGFTLKRTIIDAFGKDRAMVFARD